MNEMWLDRPKEPKLEFAIALTSVILVGGEGLAIATELSETVGCQIMRSCVAG